MSSQQKAEDLRRIEVQLGQGQHPLVLLPIASRSKRPFFKGWNKVTAAEAATAAHWDNLLWHGNTGILLGAASGGLCAIDCDSDEARDAWLKLNPRLNQTTCRVGKKGCAFLVRIVGDIPRNRNFADVGEWKADGTQLVIRGIHPKGVPYQLNDKTPLDMKWEDLHCPPGWEFDKVATESDRGGSRERATNSSSASCGLQSTVYKTPVAREGDVIKLSLEFEALYGVAGVDLYRTWVMPHETDLRKGERNTLLTHTILPQLFDKCGTQMSLNMAAEFYLRNRGKFHDPFEVHNYEALHVSMALLSRYPDELTPREAEVYLGLKEEIYRDVFRITRSLALYEDGGLPKLCFFMSQAQLAARLGFKPSNDVTARRILSRLCFYGILMVEKKGTRRGDKKPGVGTVYRWMLDLPEDEPVET